MLRLAGLAYTGTRPFQPTLSLLGNCRRQLSGFLALPKFVQRQLFEQAKRNSNDFVGSADQESQTEVSWKNWRPVGVLRTLPVQCLRRNLLPAGYVWA